MQFSSATIISDNVIELHVEFQYSGNGNYGVLPFYGCSIYLFNSKIKVGNLTLRINQANLSPNQSEQLYYEGHIGYGIYETFRGKGYAGRACLLAAHYAKEHGLKELFINCNAENIASMRVLEKLGAKRLEEFNTPPKYLDENDTTPRRVKFCWKL